MSKYRKHIWANETMPYYKQYLNEMEAQIDKLTKEGGGGGSKPLYIATYIISAINTETDFECNFAVQHFQTDNTLADNIQDAVDIVTENGEREDILASGYIAGEDIEGIGDMSPYPISSIHNMYISDENKLVIEFWSSYLGDLNAVEFDSYELKASNIKEVAAGGGGGSGMQKYEIYMDWDNEIEEYFFEHDGERLTFDDVYEAITNENNFVYLWDSHNIYMLTGRQQDDYISFTIVNAYYEESEENTVSGIYSATATITQDNHVLYAECELSEGGGGDSKAYVPIKIHLFDNNNKISGSLLTFVFGDESSSIEDPYDFWNWLRNHGYSNDTSDEEQLSIVCGSFVITDGNGQIKNINNILWIKAGPIDQSGNPTLLVNYNEDNPHAFGGAYNKTALLNFVISRNDYIPDYEPEFLDDICYAFVKFVDDQQSLHYIEIFDGVDDTGTMLNSIQLNNAEVPTLIFSGRTETGHICIKADDAYINEPTVFGEVEKTSDSDVVDINGTGGVIFKLNYEAV